MKIASRPATLEFIRRWPLRILMTSDIPGLERPGYDQLAAAAANFGIRANGTA